MEHYSLEWETFAQKTRETFKKMGKIAVIFITFLLFGRIDSV
jgi:hypothetical protein